MWTVFLVLMLQSVYGANILYLTPLASPSHYLWNRVLALELVANGHNVTMLTHDLEKDDIPKNYTVLTIEGFYENAFTNFNVEEIVDGGVITNILGLFTYNKAVCQYDLKSPAFHSLLNYPPDFKFDLIIFDIVGPICLYGFISRFHNPPVLGVTAFQFPPHHSIGFANPLYTAYTPYFNTMFTNKMNFVERTQNFIYTYLDVFLYKYVWNPYQENLARIAFNVSLPPYLDVERNISLYLVNTDPSVNYPIPLLPNIIPVGGLQIKPPKRLPQDLEDVFTSAENGVIFFSIGTNLKSSIITYEDTQTFLKVFSKLKQVVLWKSDLENLQNVPRNVVIKKWLPQNDILGHPKTKLFITHCGGLSTHETVYHGVPVVGIPYLIDQYGNMAMLLNKGVGLHVDKKNFTFNSIYGSIVEVLNNPKYTSNVKKISQNFRNQLNSPLERAVFWTEHVLKYGNPDYLDVPGRDMPFFQVADLDVLAFLLLSLFILCYVVYFTLHLQLMYFNNLLKRYF